MASESLIAIRTTWISYDVERLAARLEEVSGMKVIKLVDNRTGPRVTSTQDVIALNADTYKELGLFCPADVGWRCGDYGLYVAHRRFANVKHFWLLEDDLRIDGRASEFFSFFTARNEYDFLATNVRAAGRDWYWRTHATAPRINPYRCQFGIVRLSSRALDMLHKKRKLHSGQVTRRMLWPNDEAFVATTMLNSGLKCADINGFERTFYTGESLRLGGEPQQTSGDSVDPLIIHPVSVKRQDAPANIVVSASDRYTRKDSLGLRLKRPFARRINRFRHW